MDKKLASALSAANQNPSLGYLNLDPVNTKIGSSLEWRLQKVSLGELARAMIPVHRGHRETRRRAPGGGPGSAFLCGLLSLAMGGPQELWAQHNQELCGHMPWAAGCRHYFFPDNFTFLSEGLFLVTSILGSVYALGSVSVDFCPFLKSAL